MFDHQSALDTWLVEREWGVDARMGREWLGEECGRRREGEYLRSTLRRLAIGKWCGGDRGKNRKGGGVKTHSTVMNLEPLSNRQTCLLHGANSDHKQNSDDKK